MQTALITVNFPLILLHAKPENMILPKKMEKEKEEQNNCCFFKTFHAFSFQIKIYIKLYIFWNFMKLKRINHNVWLWSYVSWDFEVSDLD